MKRKLYIYQLMIAALSVLLSTIVLHHHHAERMQAMTRSVDALGETTHYTPDNQLELSVETTDISSHPGIFLVDERVKLAQQQIKSDKAEYLPKFYLQGGTQKSR